MATSAKRQKPKHRKRRSLERAHTRRRRHANSDPERQEGWPQGPFTVEQSQRILLSAMGQNCIIYIKIDAKETGSILDELEQLGTLGRVKSEGLFALYMTRSQAENCREVLFGLIDDGQIVVQDTKGVYLDHFRKELNPSD